jgi:uncharacterized membrane protein (UPF0127 family)
MHHTTLRFAGNTGPQAIELRVASSALERMRGLLGCAPLQAAEGMLLLSCRLIHTVGMDYPLDLVYLARDGRVLKVTAKLPARRMDGHWRAHSVLEMAAGEAARCGIVAGMQLPLGSLGQRAA